MSKTVNSTENIRRSSSRSAASNRRPGQTSYAQASNPVAQRTRTVQPKPGRSAAAAQQPGRPSGKKKQSKRARKKRNRRIRRLIFVILIILIIAAAAGYDRFWSYDSYSVTSTLSISNSSDYLEYSEFKSGYVKITESGITYFAKNGIIWSEAYSMTQPIYDICRGYIAVADVKQNEVYLFDKEGLVNKVSTQYSIIDVEVSSAGVIAAATDDDDANYIELYDKAGSELLTARSIFSSSGYLTDITLSSDGTKLAAAFINVDLLDIVSRVAFYDFSEGTSDSDVLVAGFNQYTDTVLTNVEFLSGDRVVAIGDNAVTIYDFSSAPEIIYEDLDLTWTIQSVFFSDRYFGVIINDDAEVYNYAYQVFSRTGKMVAEGGFDFSYTNVLLYGRNIMITSSNACRIYNFAGVEKFSCAFEENIEAMYPSGYMSLIYATTSETSFIRMK